MVFKIICLFFHIVDLILSVIDLTRGFITSNLKRLSGGGKVIRKLIPVHYWVLTATTRRRTAPMPPQRWWLWWASSTTSTATPAVRPVAGAIMSGMGLLTGVRLLDNSFITFLSSCDPLPSTYFSILNWKLKYLNFISTIWIFYPFIRGILIVPALLFSHRGWVFPISLPSHHYTEKNTNTQQRTFQTFPRFLLAPGKF